jgi:hypothetical protein
LVFCGEKKKSPVTKELSCNEGACTDRQYRFQPLLADTEADERNEFKTMLPSFPPRKVTTPSSAPRFIPHYRPNVAVTSPKVSENAPPSLPLALEQRFEDLADQAYPGLKQNQAENQSASSVLAVTNSENTFDMNIKKHPITILSEEEMTSKDFFETNPKTKKQKISSKNETTDKAITTGKQTDEPLTAEDIVFAEVHRQSSQKKSTKKTLDETSNPKKAQTPKTSNASVDDLEVTTAIPNPTTTAKKSRKSSKKQDQPLFPFSYLQLVHYPLPYPEDIQSLSFPHQKKIVTYMKLSPKGIAGLQFTNYDNRAVITGIHPVLFQESTNGKYGLQLYDMIYSVNHLDARYATFQQLINAIHHENEEWKEVQNNNNPVTTNTTTTTATALTISSSSSNTDPSQSNNNPNNNKSTASPANNTNIYINDMNDPNYHSNRTLLKNAIIDSMANIVFIRLLR